MIYFAEEGQFSKATLYRYFDSKKDIFLVIVFHSFDEALAEIKRVKEKNICAKDKLKEFINVVFSFHQKKKQIARIFFMEKISMQRIFDMEPDEKTDKSSIHNRIPKEMRIKLAEVFDVLNGILEEGVANNEFRNLDIKNTSFIIGALFRGFSLRGPLVDREYSINEVTELLYSFILNGIKNDKN